MKQIGNLIIDKQINLLSIIFRSFWATTSVTMNNNFVQHQHNEEVFLSAREALDLNKLRKFIHQIVKFI